MSLQLYWRALKRSCRQHLIGCCDCGLVQALGPRPEVGWRRVQQRHGRARDGLRQAGLCLLEDCRDLQRKEALHIWLMPATLLSATLHGGNSTSNTSWWHYPWAASATVRGGGMPPVLRCQDCCCCLIPQVPQELMWPSTLHTFRCVSSCTWAARLSSRAACVSAAVQPEPLTSKSRAASSKALSA